MFPALKRRAIFRLSLRDKFICANFIVSKSRRPSGGKIFDGINLFRRNVRVSAFTFEPVRQYIEHFPWLADVFCFSSDYPHFAGGRNPIAKMAEMIRPLPEADEPSVS